MYLINAIVVDKLNKLLITSKSRQIYEKGRNTYGRINYIKELPTSFLAII